MELGELICDIAYGAGRIVKERYKTVKQCKTKSGVGDVVTEVDLLSEKYIIDRLKTERPQDSILSEECGSIGEIDDNNVWIIDPIDGTRNYATGIPFFCVSIGVVKNGISIAGAIYDPIHDEMFFAEKGKGAFMNKQPISVSDDKTIEDCLVSISWVKEKADKESHIKYMNALADETSYFRRFGSAALVMSYVANGKLHGYVQSGLCPWDIAAGVVIIKEAGGIVTDFDGNPLDLYKKNISLVCGNQLTYDHLFELVNNKE